MLSDKLEFVSPHKVDESWRMIFATHEQSFNEHLEIITIYTCNMTNLPWISAELIMNWSKFCVNVVWFRHIYSKGRNVNILIRWKGPKYSREYSYAIEKAKIFTWIFLCDQKGRNIHVNILEYSYEKSAKIFTWIFESTRIFISGA